MSESTNAAIDAANASPESSPASSPSSTPGASATTPPATTTSPASSPVTSPSTSSAPASSPATPSPAAAAAQRISQALEEGGKVKGFQGPEHGKLVGRGKRRVRMVQRQIVELQAGDVVAVASAIGEKTDKIKELHVGTSPHAEEQLVNIWADDAFHLVEEFEKTQTPAK